MSIRTSVSFSALKGDLGCAVSRRVYRPQQTGPHSLPSETGLDFAPVSLCDFADIEEGIASVRWLTTSTSTGSIGRRARRNPPGSLLRSDCRADAGIRVVLDFCE